jgi:hypothetical protein
MAEEDIQEDGEPAPVPEEALDEAQETQINRMAGCARLGKWLAYAALIVLAVIFFQKCATMQ